jgi:hypothetical protein
MKPYLLLGKNDKFIIALNVAALVQIYYTKNVKSMRFSGRRDVYAGTIENIHYIGNIPVGKNTCEREKFSPS